MDADENNPAPVSRTEQIDLLMKMHAALRGDILLQIGSLKNHVRNSQIILAVFGSAALGLMKSSTFALANDTKYYWIFFMVLVTTVTYYLLYDVFDSVFSINVVAELLAALERRVNKMAKADILMWDRITESLYGSAHPFGGVLQPLWMVSIYQIIGLFMITIFLPLFVYYQAWMKSDGGICISFWVVLCSLYSIGSALIAVYAGLGVMVRLRGRARETIEKNWNL